MEIGIIIHAAFGCSTAGDWHGGSVFTGRTKYEYVEHAELTSFFFFLLCLQFGRGSDVSLRQVSYYTHPSYVAPGRRYRH